MSEEKLQSFDVWSVILFRLMNVEQFNYEFEHESVLDVTLFYATKILPCVNDFYAETKSTKRLSQVNNVHDEVFAFFIFVFLARNSGINGCVPFFQKNNFHKENYSEAIQRIVRFLDDAYAGLKLVHDGTTQEQKFPRANCKTFQDKCYKPLFALFSTLRGLEVCAHNEIRLMNLIRNREFITSDDEFKKTKEPPALVDEETLKYVGIDFGETNISNSFEL